MFQDVLTFIAARFFYTGNLRNISFLSLVCVLGTGLSISILICILSIMNGFEEEVKSRSFGADGHILINLLDKSNISLKEAQLKIEHFWAGSLKKAVIDGDIDNGSLMAGQSVSLVKKIQSVNEIISEIVKQAEKQISHEQRVSG